MARKGLAMEHKGIRYTVVQTIDKAFKWTVELTNRELSGEVRNRTWGILKAIKAIEKDDRRMRSAKRTTERNEQNNSN
jgi:hypothetical protein